MGLLDELEFILISLSKPDQTLEWTYGDVKKPENVHYLYIDIKTGKRGCSLCDRNKKIKEETSDS